jgi:serine/threonine protein kinase
MSCRFTVSTGTTVESGSGDFVRAKTLSALLSAQGPFGPGEAAHIAIDLCRAVGAVHAAGLLHRDIKTGNAMREEGGHSSYADVRSWECHQRMKTTSADRTYIDYWQDYGTGIKSHFGIRVWADHCSAITNVGSANPNLFGTPRDLPVNLSGTEGQHSLKNVISEHTSRHPDSDLVDVLTGKKSFEEALG